MKKFQLIVGIVALVVLLGGAAFVAGRLLNNAPPPAGQVVAQSSGGDVPPGKPQTLAAKELPQTPATIGGVFVSRKDNSVMIGTGQLQWRPRTNPDGTVAWVNTYDGPVVEIVFTRDTILFRDVSAQQYKAQPSGGNTYQQVVEPGRLDEIGEDSLVTVWGERRGERVTATTVLYMPPKVVKPPAK